MTTLILIRHGQSQANHQSIFAGNFDADLHENGLKQAQKTADYIAETYKVDTVYASDLKRAYKTGKAVADRLGLDVIPNQRLREIRAGQWEGVTFDELSAQYAEDYSLWLSDIGNSGCTGGETVKQLGDRIVSAVTEIAKENDGKTVAIATHATPIRVMQCLLGGHSLDEMKNIPWVSNCSVTELHYNNGSWDFAKIGYDKHLSALRSSLPANV